MTFFKRTAKTLEHVATVTSQAANTAENAGAVHAHMRNRPRRGTRGETLKHYAELAALAASLGISVAELWQSGGKAINHLQHRRQVGQRHRQMRNSGGKS